MPAGETDLTLLAKGLRDSFSERRAAVGRIGRLDRCQQGVVLVGRPQERAHPWIARAGPDGQERKDGIACVIACGSVHRSAQVIGPAEVDGFGAIWPGRLWAGRGIELHMPSINPSGWNGAESSTFRELPRAIGRC